MKENTDEEKYKVETIFPEDNNSKRKEKQIENMFDSISKKYDQMNFLMSFGLDKYWRKKAIKILKKEKAEKIIDIATGTGDLSFCANKILKPQKIVACDISNNMLGIARKKANKKNIKNIEFIINSSDKLPFNENYFDIAIIAFGIRNFENINLSLKEIKRVIKNNGKIMILEFSEPENIFVKMFFNIHTKITIPFFAKIITKNNKAYQYLSKSIKAFPKAKEMTKILIKNGFENCIYKKLSFGICNIYIGTKNNILK